MKYTTIVMELLQANSKLHEQLRRKGALLRTLNEMALALKACHHSWMEELAETRPGSSPIQLASEAMELAVQELQDSLPGASEPEEATTESEPLSLDAAMSFLRRHTPPE